MDIEKTGKKLQVRSSKEYKLTTWKDSCRELFTRIRALRIKGNIMRAPDSCKIRPAILNSAELMLDNKLQGFQQEALKQFDY